MSPLAAGLGTATALDDRFDVRVTSVSLSDDPASIRIDAEIAGHPLYSVVQYDAIRRWADVWSRFRDADNARRQMIGCIVLWECMRFLLLGGRRLSVPAEYEPCPEIIELWKRCFVKQVGEWRYRNGIRRQPHYPELVLHADRSSPGSQLVDPGCTASDGKARYLLTNGGGKDTLLGCLLLDAIPDSSFDLYEGYLPVGGTLEKQKELLALLRNSVQKQFDRIVSVTVRDNFHDLVRTNLSRLGIKARYWDTDFAVGHTANYVGYFPLIARYDYRAVYFNIEQTANLPNVDWDGDFVSHQWCKSEEYREIAGALYRKITGSHHFDGFRSTLDGFSDTYIYQVLRRYPEHLKNTHSCNYGKPWCNRCVKCCFCYLMMSAYLSEDYAMGVMGVGESLFLSAENSGNWNALLSDSEIAWECVGPTEECRLAATVLVNKGASYPVLTRCRLHEREFEALDGKYNRLNRDEIKSPLMFDAIGVVVARSGREYA